MDNSPNVTIIPAKEKPSVSTENEDIIKVAAYCRVSTGEKNQQNSYAVQISYYNEYIRSKPNWRFAGIFADEGITGTQTKNRKQFAKMIRAAKCGKIDLILCKSISRFARNTVDCLDYIRELKALGVAVLFEKEHINTSSMTSEFVISLFASFAQAESESISQNTIWGIQKTFRKGIVHYKVNQMLGYRLGADNKPYIIEEEAVFVRYIFNKYATGVSCSEIAASLTKMNAVRRNGSSNWTRHNVYQILKNEKYVGDAIMQKTYTENCITHDRRKNKGQRPMYLVQNCHDPIIDRATYNAVRLELDRRKRTSTATAVTATNTATAADTAKQSSIKHNLEE